MSLNEVECQMQEEQVMICTLFPTEKVLLQLQMCFRDLVPLVEN